MEAAVGQDFGVDVSTGPVGFFSGKGIDKRQEKTMMASVDRCLLYTSDAADE